MTVEQLLKDRYKVIALYPHSPYEIGDLVEISELGTSFHCTTTTVWSTFDDDYVKSENYWSISNIEKYPHLFKKIHWSEEREEKDIPEFVKSLLTGEVIKPFMIDAEVGVLYEDATFHSERDGSSLRYWKPSTIEEYNEYININSKK